jgi:hypothetical protein
MVQPERRQLGGQGIERHGAARAARRTTRGTHRATSSTSVTYAASERMTAPGAGNAAHWAATCCCLGGHLLLRARA